MSIDDDDDGSTHDDHTPLKHPGRTGRAGLNGSPDSLNPAINRWPWVLLGVFLGLLAVLFGSPSGVGASAASSAGSETTCGAVPTVPPPLVRRSLDGQVRNVLVTGGAGFIASHFALALLDRKGYNVTIVDDLSRGSIETVLRLQTIAHEAGQPLNWVRMDVNEEHKLVELLQAHSIEVVVHFSGNAYVGESMLYPEAYYQNITASTVSIVRAMNRVGIGRLIFSSSCATFGAPATFPITETTPQRPTNPYGQAKLQAEQAIVAFLRAQERHQKPFSAALLRYFNVVGADPAGRLGPHLLHKANVRFPRILDAAYDVALGLRSEMVVTGDNFPTKDGSAQRDYIHVSDLVDAHVQLMLALKSNDLLYYNVGNGQPFTVLEIVDVVKRVSGRPLPVKMAPARLGDPPILYTDPKKIKYEIGWKPRFPDVESMVRHGWEWRVKHYGNPPARSIDPLMHNYVAFTAENDTAPALKDNPRIVVIGAGPTGLCAAYRLTELGYTNWELLEGTKEPAGLACTIKDENHFAWDIGVHCLFSHFEFFDALLDSMLPPSDWLYHQRYSPARMRNTWVGYPVQANVWRLPEPEVMKIITDLTQKDARPRPPPPRNFEDFLIAKFGAALTETFMAPYNAKVWAHPAREMNHIWVGERVAEIKSSAVLSNIINRRDAPKWGPNAQFRYPMNGTGHIWVKIFEELPRENKRLGAQVVSVRTRDGAKAVELADGSRVPFDGLLSTMPLPSLLRMTPDHPSLAKLADGDNGAADHSRFKHQTVNLVGVGIWGTAVPSALDGVHWVYFPEDEYIFYRVTVLSNFSPLMVPKPYQQWSLLIEVSESRFRKQVWSDLGNSWPTDDEDLKRQVIAGLRRGGMMPPDAKVASTWTKRLEYGYPVPYVERNMHVHEADEELRKLGVWSRGRFGSWKYEVGNQDHSCMLGYDAVDSMLFGGNGAGREATFNSPDVVNSGYRRYDRHFDPAQLARDAGRNHKFEKPPRRIEKLPQWDWVLPHCDEPDGWLDKIRTLMVGLPVLTKWLVHGYERCGVAEVKRPMKEMLREGLNHHDRIPFTTKAPGLAAWVKHILTHYDKLPDFLFFTPASVPTSSHVFQPDAIAQSQALKGGGGDFAVWGSRTVELPQELRKRFCRLVWPLTPKARKRNCPERIVSMADAVTMVSKRRIHMVSKATWKLVYDLVDTAEKADDEQLLAHGWHLLLGQPPVIPHRSTSRH